MEYRKLGQSELKLSAVTFGAWAIGGWMWGGADKKDAIEAIHTAVDLGITSIDTAPVYGFGVSEEIVGEAFVNRLRVRNVKTRQESGLDVSGVFVSVGFKPNTDYLKGILNLDAAGAVVINERMETGVPGILAAGDIRSSSIRQVIAAVGDGATAAIYAEKYITG